MNARLILTGLLAAALAACGAMPKLPSLPGARPAPQRQDIFPAAAPTPTVGMDWYFVPSDDEALLVYGASPGTGLKFGVLCVKGETTFAVTQVADSARGDSVIFYSLRSMFVYPASAESERTGGQLLTVELGRADDGLAALKTNGWIWVDGPGGQFSGHAPQPGTTAVADFFAWCG